MSTSIIIVDQKFNANYVDIMVFEPSVLFPPAAVWGGIEHMVPQPPTFMLQDLISMSSVELRAK